MADFNLVQTGVISAVDADDAGPKTVALSTPVKISSSRVTGTIRYNRTGTQHGANLTLIAGGGPGLYDTVELSWDGSLGAGETITARFYVYDPENMGDDLKEILFRLQLIQGLLGANSVQDAIIFDDAGNMTSYRVRIFDNKTNTEDANLDIADGAALDPGELCRLKMIQDIDFAKNDRNSLIRVVLLKAPTPGVN